MALPQTQHDTKTLPDAWDYKGRPALRSSSGGWSSAAMILGIEAVERLTTLGIAVNLVTYLTGTMHLGNASAANNVTNFLGTSFMLTLLGGFVADTFLGRYLTIGIFTTIQATGVTILTISTIIPSLRPSKCESGSSTCIPASGKQLMVLYVALYMTALGTGGLKSSVSGFLDKAAIKVIDPESAGFTVVNKWNLSTLTDVEEVKLVIRMLPTWATTIMFWTVYAQMTTFSVSQATTMDRHMGNFEIPPASLTLFFVGSILLTCIFYDRVVVPIAKRVLNNPHGLSPLQRIAVGLVLSIIAMIAAALTEVKRLNVAHSHGLTNDANAIVPLSVFWLVPQFLLVGAGEAFTYIGQLDFFLRECPKGMKTMSTGLFLSTLSLGFFVSSILVSVVHKVTGNKPWLADNLNQGRLYDFYWLLATLSVLNLMVFLFLSRRYVYKEKRLAEVGIEMEDSGPSCH
ncbi:unnamed protein product [Withania somnifera]